MIRSLLIVALVAASAPVLACKSDSDCPSDKECKESVSGNMRCYPREDKKDKDRKGDYKKTVLRCDKTCPEEWSMCGVAPCKKSPQCCYLPED